MHDTGCLWLVHWDDPEGWYGEGGGTREEGLGCGTCAYLWWIHVDTWQNQYYIVKLKNTIKKKKNFQQNGEGQGRLRGHPARCDAAPSLRTVLPLSVTIEILCNLNRPSWQHRCPRTLPAMPGKVILRRGVISKLGPGAHLCTKTPGTVMLVWGSSLARPHRTCVCLPQGIQPRDTARPVPRNFRTAEFMPD